MRRPLIIGLGAALLIALALVIVPRSWLVGPQEFSVRGRVAGLSDDPGRIIVEHEEIPGYMPAMTMPINVRDTALVRELALGDAIAFDFHVEVDTTWAQNLRKISDDSVAAHPARGQLGVNLPDQKPLLEKGDALPQVTLVDQDSTEFQPQRFEGDLLLLTFIYTSCPLPNYCPLMSKNFAAVDQGLSPSVRRQVHLLSISFDTRHDTPAVLREYAGRYTDSTERWTFAVGSPDAIGEITSRFGVFYTYQDVEDIQHNLVTALVDRRGRIEQIWRGNDWTPEEVIEAIRGAAGTE